MNDKGVFEIVPLFVGGAIAVLIATIVYNSIVTDELLPQINTVSNFSTIETLMNLAPLLVVAVFIVAIVGYIGIGRPPQQQY